MLICKECGKMIANSHPNVTLFGLCHECFNNRRACPCGSGKIKYELTDARGIFVTFVCDDCVKERKSHYRPEIFTDSQYETTEPIDEDN